MIKTSKRFFILCSALAACGGILAGLRLLALPSSIKFMVTGAVLLLAVTMDAYIRSRREPSGR